MKHIAFIFVLVLIASSVATALWRWNDIAPEKGPRTTRFGKNIVTLVIALLSGALFADFEFYTDGDAEWFEQGEVVHNGSSAWQSGEITDNQSTALFFDVPRPGFLSFFWKVSSEQGYDKLSFYLDGDLYVYKLPKCTYTCPGYHFKGWCSEEGRFYDDGMLIFNLVPDNSGIRFYATWEKEDN